jgi:hypothetical protein
MENTSSLDIARMAAFKLLAVKSYLARIARSFIRGSHKFTLLINVQGRSKSFSCIYIFISFIAHSLEIYGHAFHIEFLDLNFQLTAPLIFNTALN